MNMELFCGWELAYVFCLISGPHSHFKGRSTRGLDFLICLATESTTCMWDQLPTRADNPTASKYRPLPTPTLSSLLCCPSLYPPAPNQPPPPVLPIHIGPSLGLELQWSHSWLPMAVGESERGREREMLLGMFSGLAQLPQGHCFCFYRESQCQCDMEKWGKKEGEAALCNFSAVVLFAACAISCHPGLPPAMRDVIGCCVATATLSTELSPDQL